jgi:hypothetical protein
MVASYVTRCHTMQKISIEAVVVEGGGGGRG